MEKTISQINADRNLALMAPYDPVRVGHSSLNTQGESIWIANAIAGSCLL